MFENDVATFDGKVLRIKDGVVKIDVGILEKSYECMKDDTLQIEVVIPDSVKVIYAGAFTRASNITKVSIPNSVIQLVPHEQINPITIGTFRGCVDLEEIVLSNRLNEISELAFSLCKKLKKIIIPNGKLTRIEYEAFFGCKELEEVTIPNSVEIIETGVFHDCKSLKNIVIPSKVIILGDRVFKGCSRLEEIKVPRHLVETYGKKYIRCGTKATITVYDGIIIEEDTIETQNKTTNQPKTSSIKSYNGVVRRNIIADKRWKAIKSQNGDSKK